MAGKTRFYGVKLGNGGKTLALGSWEPVWGFKVYFFSFLSKRDGFQAKQLFIFPADMSTILLIVHTPHCQ